MILSNLLKLLKDKSIKVQKVKKEAYREAGLAEKVKKAEDTQENMKERRSTVLPQELVVVQAAVASKLR